MPTKVLMPALSPTMTEGNLAKWHVKEGDTVEAGDVIAEIETDKATMEVEAVDEGKLVQILIGEGSENVAVNTPIAVLLEEGEDESALKDLDLEGSVAPEQNNQAQDNKEDKAEAQSDAPAKNLSAPASQAQKGKRIFASPLARRIAEQKGLDLSSIQGSGPNGRIVKADVENVQPGKENKPSTQSSAAAPVPSSAPASSSGPDAKQLSDMLGMEYEEIPNNNMRKVVARRLLESKQTVPHFYLTVEMQIDTLLATRKEINAQADGAYKLSVNDFVIKCAANALKAYPAANVAWTDAAILQYKHADISVAVATPNGLITPVIKAAETKGLVDISREMKDLAGRAREGKLKPEEFQGGTFSISNLGMFGVSDFGAIINPPQACILAVGAGEQKPYVDGGEVKIGTFMKCTLSVDHRAVDGAVGAEYLQHFKKYIEKPMSMLL